MHEFFYEQSNYKVGASENNLQLDFKVKEKDLNKYSYLRKTSEKFYPVSNTKFLFFKKLTNSRLKLHITKKLIYSVSIFSFVLIFGFIIFFISQPNKNKSNITNKSFVLEKEF